MAEQADIAVIDGEEAGITPWEFDFIQKEGSVDFSLQAVAACHGTYGYKYTGDGRAQYARGVYAFTDLTDFYVRLYICIDPNFAISGFTGDTLRALLLVKDGSNDRWMVGLHFTSGIPDAWLMQSNGLGVTRQQISTNFSLDMWHWIELHLAENDSEMWVDDVSVHTGSPVLVNYDTIQIGYYDLYASPGDGHYIYFDDIVVSTTGPIGLYRSGKMTPWLVGSKLAGVPDSLAARMIPASIISMAKKAGEPSIEKVDRPLTPNIEVIKGPF